jgi:hypothetical protein
MIWSATDATTTTAMIEVGERTRTEKQKQKRATSQQQKIPRGRDTNGRYPKKKEMFEIHME